jgi:hypothetical protein
MKTIACESARAIELRTTADIFDKVNRATSKAFGAAVLFSIMTGGSSAQLFWAGVAATSLVLAYQSHKLAERTTEKYFYRLANDAYMGPGA